MATVTREMFKMFPMDEKTKNKVQPASHKIIEKRRRDRINNCLAELSQTVPAAFAKQSSGKLEKAEILEMTVEYLRTVQTTELGLRFDKGQWFSPDIWGDFMQHYRSGYSDCMREVVRFMADVEGIDANDSRCVRMLTYLHTRFRPDNSVNGDTPSVRYDTPRLTAMNNFVTTDLIGEEGPCGGVRSHHRHLIGQSSLPLRLTPFSNLNCSPPSLISRTTPLCLDSHSSRQTAFQNDQSGDRGKASGRRN